MYFFKKKVKTKMLYKNARLARGQSIYKKSENEVHESNLSYNSNLLTCKARLALP